MLTARSHLVARIHPFALLSLLSILIGSTAQAVAATEPSQSEVEAVYLFDFGKFVHWPAGADQGNMSICVAGSPSFAAAMQRTIANENIGGRSLDVRRVIRPADESGCAILFIEASLHLHPEDLLQPVAAKPTLTVSDMPDFLTHGGMIQFQLVASRIRFSVNLDAVSRARLTMSSELLKVAFSVKGRTPEGGAPRERRTARTPSPAVSRA
jgi:YfiR/HmsC-like